jgi:hypothetical protein
MRVGKDALASTETSRLCLSAKMLLLRAPPLNCQQFYEWSLRVASGATRLKNSRKNTPWPAPQGRGRAVRITSL